MSTETMHNLPLSLTKRPSNLDGLVLLEFLPMVRMKALLKSNLLLNTWEWENYENEKAQITAYMKLYNTKLGGVPVKYIKPKHKWGRSFPTKSLGLSAIRRECRNALLKGLYYDFDIKNAQPEIIKNLCMSNNIPCPIIKRYCESRETLLTQIQEKYKVTRIQAKDLFIRCCFSGSFAGWCFDNKLTEPPLEYITLFERELKDIMEKAKIANPSLYETARKKKEDAGEKKENKVLGSFFALFNQEYESRIVEAVLCHILHQTDLMKISGTDIPVGTYEYDGIKLLKENVDRYDGGKDAVVELLNEKTLELTGFRLEWSIKSLDDGYCLDEFIINVEIEEKPSEELLSDCLLISNAIDNSDCGIVETIMKIMPKHFVYSVDKNDTSKGDWYGWNGCRWEKGDAPLRKAIMYEVEKYWKSILDKWKYLEEVDVDVDGDDTLDANHQNVKIYGSTKKKMTDRLFMLKSANGVNSVASVAKTLMADFTLEFDTKQDLFGCQNGVIDFAEECFRPYRFDDYVTFSCGYDFIPLTIGLRIIKDDETEFIIQDKDLKPQNQILIKDLMEMFACIFPDEELRNYFFKIISTGMSGKAIEKFFIFNGGGRNGKGVTNEFLNVVFGDYYESVSYTVFTEDQKKKNSSGCNPEIAKLDKKRYVVSKEPPKDQPLHNNVIKDMTGGGYTSGRFCNSNKSNVKLSMTCIMEANKKPPFGEEPTDADVERIDDILFASKFTANDDEWDINTNEKNHIYPLNPKYKDAEWKNLHKNAMLNILIGHLLEVKRKNYVLDNFRPNSVKQRSLEYLQNSYSVHNIFQSLFEIRKEENKGEYKDYKGNSMDEDWTMPKVAQEIRKSREFFEMPKKRQKEYSAENIVNFIRTNAYYKSSCYRNENKHAWFMRNWRLKPLKEECEE
jgi:phage/plasmid-associated DNA primase